VAQLFEPLSGAAELYSRAQKTFASVRQVQHVLVLQPLVVDAPGAHLNAPDRAEDIEFVGVEFGYKRQKRMLRLPSLSILPGERLVIAGENGAGKSTLAKLIVRLYDVDCGSVRIGGEDVRNIRLDSLRRYVCYIPREPALFDGSVGFNLRFVKRSVSDEELRDALQNAGLLELVRTFPKGFDQRIGPGGCQLSGGERQRFAIARALLQKPKIVVLDEATSCLDPYSEELILRNVFRSLAESTVLVVSHRHSTSSLVARKIFMSDGEIVSDQGTDAANAMRSRAGFSPSMPATAD
jgi:ATP-binding cassette subfamily B protein